MRRVSGLVAGICVGLSLFLVSLSHSQETKPAAKDAPKAKVDAKAEKAADDAKAKKGRLPNYFGKLGLSDAQRTKVLSIQSSHADELDKLEKAMADLKAKQNEEYLAVLTAEQKTHYTQMVDAAKKKREERAKQMPKDDDDDDAPATPAAK